MADILELNTEILEIFMDRIVSEVYSWNFMRDIEKNVSIEVWSAMTRLIWEAPAVVARLNKKGAGS